jgi:hypothetical protein
MSEKSRSLSGKGRSAAARPTFRPTVEALEDRMLLSYSIGVVNPGVAVGGLQVAQESRPVEVVSFSPGTYQKVVIGQSLSVPSAPPGVQPDHVSLNFAGPTSLQTADGGTTALTYTDRFLKIDTVPAAPSYYIKTTTKAAPLQEMASADGTAVTPPGQTSLQAPDGGTIPLTWHIISIKKA